MSVLVTMEFVISCAVLLVLTYLFFDKVLRALKVGNYGNKYVFVTGCDSGFGQRLVVRLDGLGFHVFAGCLTDEGRKYLSSNCSKRVVTVPLDVTKGESIQAALQLVKETLPENTGLWGLVNNAGIAGLICFGEVCIPEDYQQVFAVNLFGAIEMSRAFLPLLRKAGGRLVATTSVCGRLAFGADPYTVSKFCLEAYMDLLRRELYNKGVMVILVEPGGFKSSIISVEQLVVQVRAAYNRANEEVQDTYRVAMANYERNLNQLVASCNPNLDIVANDYIHGLTSRFPRTRYSPGLDAKLFYIPVSYLPTRFSDWLLQGP